MNHKQLLNALSNNRSAQFLLFEIQNLHDHYKHPDQTDAMVIHSRYDYFHTMTDTIENLYSVLCDMLQLPNEIADDPGFFDILASINLTTLNPAYIRKQGLNFIKS